MNDIYQAPQTELTESSPVGDYGSVEKGVAGDYEFSVEGTLREAWEKTDGNKGTVWVAMLIYIAIYFVASLVVGLVSIPLASAFGEVAAQFIAQIPLMIVIAPIAAGLMMLGVKLAVGRSAEPTSILSYYDKVVPLALTSILMTVLIMIGFMLLIVPGIYLAVAYVLATPLVADKGLSPWEALETSRKAITKKWFSVFGFMVAMSLIMMVSVLLIGIPLIWTVPMGVIAMGILYRNVFGYEGGE